MGQPVPPPIPYTYWLLFEECSAKYIPEMKTGIFNLYEHERKNLGEKKNDNKKS